MQQVKQIAVAVKAGQTSAKGAGGGRSDAMMCSLVWTVAVNLSASLKKFAKENVRFTSLLVCQHAKGSKKPHQGQSGSHPVVLSLPLISSCDDQSYSRPQKIRGSHCQTLDLYNVLLQTGSVVYTFKNNTNTHTIRTCEVCFSICIPNQRTFSETPKTKGGMASFSAHT